MVSEANSEDFFPNSYRIKHEKIILCECYYYCIPEYKYLVSSSCSGEAN